MRRAAPVAIATVAGLGLLAEFHTAPSSTAVSAGAGTPVSAAPSAPATVGIGASTTTTARSGGTKTVDGPVVSTRFGDVQVRVVLNGSKITDIKALTLPTDRERSAAISDEAGPILRQEVLQAQSAHINIVSGATYTSVGYAKSLQAALDQAGK